jgi:hypothetical protein
MLQFVCYNVLARPDEKMMMTTEEPKITEQSTMMITNMTDAEDVSDEYTLESGEDDSEETDSSEEDKITVDSKTAFICPSKPLEITDLESQCLAEYKAMKKAKCNTTEEKMKKISPMESMESDSHALHMGKREISMADDMMNTTETTTKAATTHHRKRSCYYYRCILKKLDVLDETTMLPNEDMFNAWVANNITDDGEKERLQERVKECFNELRESGFYSTDSSKTAEVSGETPNVKKGKTSCNAALKLLKCLSKQDSQCPTQILG